MERGKGRKTDHKREGEREKERERGKVKETSRQINMQRVKEIKNER